MTYYILVALSWLGLVWELKPVPERVLAAGRASAHRHDGRPGAQQLIHEAASQER